MLFFRFRIEFWIGLTLLFLHSLPVFAQQTDGWGDVIPASEEMADSSEEETIDSSEPSINKDKSSTSEQNADPSSSPANESSLSEEQSPTKNSSLPSNNEDKESESKVPLNMENERQEKEEKIRETLLYGINTEIASLIEKLESQRDLRFNNELNGLLSSADNKLKKTILDFFIAVEWKEASNDALSILDNYYNEDNQDVDLLLTTLDYVKKYDITQAKETLRELTEDDNETVAARAILVLGNIGDETDTIFFQEQLEDNAYSGKRSKLKGEAILALGGLGYSQSIELLIGYANDETEEKTNRYNAILSLGKIGDPAAIPLLEELCASNDTMLRHYAILGISHFEGEEIDNILLSGLRASFWKTRVAAAKILGDRESNISFKALKYRVENDPEGVVRQAAMAAIMKLKPAGEEYLTSLFEKNDNTKRVRLAAMRTLLRGESPQVIDLLIDELNNAGKESFDTKTIFSEAVKVEWDGLSPIYELMLQSTRQEDRLFALRCISRSRISGLIDKVSVLAEDEDENEKIQDAAKETLAILISEKSS